MKVEVVVLVVMSLEMSVGLLFGAISRCDGGESESGGFGCGFGCGCDCGYGRGQ